MSRLNANESITPSILDRLIDPSSAGTVAQRGYTVEQMEVAVRRDLEDLLNTHQPYHDLPLEFKELHKSVLNYGLPDLSCVAAITSAQREQLGQVLESIIALHECRLKDVRVELRDGGKPTDRAITFRVDAKLRLDPAPEVAFDTILELMTGQYSVRTPTA
jgi:type VI secretion system protein ImpF